MIGIFREPAFRMRVERKYKGDVYSYEVEFLKHGVRTCTVRQFCTDNQFEAVVSSDNLYIDIQGSFNISGLDGQDEKKICRLKIPKHYQPHINDQVLI